MTFKKAPILHLKLRRAARPLLAQFTQELNNELAPWIGPIELKASETYYSVWRDSHAQDKSEAVRVQLAAYWAVTIGGCDLTLHMILSHPAKRAFTGVDFSPEFVAVARKQLALSVNDQFAMGWDFDLGRPEANKWLKPWETVRFRSFSPDSMTVDIYDELKQKPTRNATVSYEPVPGSEERTLLRGGVLIGDKRVWASTYALVHYAIVMAASQDEAAAQAWLAKAAGSEGATGQSYDPQTWVDTNYGRARHRKHGHVRGVVSRTLAAFTGPVVAVDGPELKLVVSK